MIITRLHPWGRHRVTTSREDFRLIAKAVLVDDARDPSPAARGLIVKIAFARATGQPLPVIEVDDQELALLLAAAGAPA